MNGTKILLVEDEPSIAEIVELYLSRAGFQVQALKDGNAALESLQNEFPDLLVLDLMLPGFDGLSITRWLRDRSEVPIIMLTARREESDRIAGLEMGADDYMVKPFSPQELVSRVRAVLRRSKAPGGEPVAAIHYNDLDINPITRTVYVHGEEVLLTVKEFDMLWLLARHPRQVFSRVQLLEQVWGFAEYIDPGTVTVHIRRIREKVEADPSAPLHLQTVWGIGYKYEP
ncbi:MAG: DNA-binding response regulator [Chloroflexi bacterium RBG_16_54_11]|nr:MAG: DNA-binding response regulator [Chloroflexi bacterium RBG_16_54_11]